MNQNPIDKKQYPHCYSGFQYALDVVSKNQISCKYILGSCNRFLKEYFESQKENSKYVFDIEYVERYLKLVQKFEHIIGNNWETKHIKYLPWQNWVWMASLGFFFKDNILNPKYRTLHIEIPRGSGKSAMASQFANFCVGLDNKSLAGSVIACFSTKIDQSRIVLDAARAMASKNKSFIKATGVKVTAHKIINSRTFSEVKAMSSDSKSMDGLNLRAAILDELHQMDRSLFDVVVSGQKKRRDSLTLCITTAGFDTEGVGFSQSQYAKKVAIGEIKDESFFSAVYTIDEGDDPFNETTWKKANPNFGVSVDPVAFEATAAKAKEVPADLANFKVKHLNIWLSEGRAFFDMEKWDACADLDLRLEDFTGKQCIAALDVASKIDLTSLALIFKKDDIYYIFDKSFIPEDTAKTVKNTLYDNCIGKGHLIATKGQAINYDALYAEIMSLAKKYRITDLNADPWNATEIMQRLQKANVNVVEFRMTTANLSEPTKRLDALIRQNKVRHNGSPLLRWALGNVVCKEDHNGNVFPRKTSEKQKIDPAISIIMALATYIQKEQTESVYSSRGIRFL